MAMMSAGIGKQLLDVLEIQRANEGVQLSICTTLKTLAQTADTICSELVRMGAVEAMVSALQRCDAIPPERRNALRSRWTQVREQAVLALRVLTTSETAKTAEVLRQINDAGLVGDVF
eukprot:11298232-Prorocentrum_lima.AAC.1